MQIEVPGPTFFSMNDEAAMFEWLHKIRKVSVKGVGRNLVFDVRLPLSHTGLRELLGLFFRYRLDMRPLAALRTTANESWFASPHAYWFEAVFSNNALVARSDEELEAEAARLESFVAGKVVKTIWRHRPAELGVEFEDGVRLFVDGHDEGLEFSIN